MYLIDGNSFTTRKQITINNNSGNALTDYQVPLTVEYESAMQTDFSDIIFAYANETLIPYWIESKTDSTTSSVWIKVDLPNYGTTPTGDNIVYVYYGNEIISSASDGDNTFVLFDDFAGKTLDATKWETATKYGTVSQDDGLVLYTGSSAAHAGAGVIAVNPIPAGDYIIESMLHRVAVKGAGEAGLYIGLTVKEVQDTTYYGGWDFDGEQVSANLYLSTSLGERLLAFYDSANERKDSAETVTFADVDVVTKLSYIESTTTADASFTYSSNTYGLTVVGAAAITTLYPMIHYGEYQILNYGYAYNYKIRLYVATEPTVTISGEGTFEALTIAMNADLPLVTGEVITPLTISMRLSLPSVVIYPSLTLYPGLYLFPGNSIPMPDTLQADEADKSIVFTFYPTEVDASSLYERSKLFNIVSSYSEVDALSYYDRLKSLNIVSSFSGTDIKANSEPKTINILSNHFIYEAFSINEIDTYIVPMPTVTVSHIDYQTFNDVSKLINIVSILTHTDREAFYDASKSINIVSTLTHIDNQLFYDSKSVNMSSIFSQHDLFDMTDIHTVSFIISVEENNIQTFYEVAKTISGILTVSAVDVEAFYEPSKLIDMIMTPTHGVHVPYIIHMNAINRDIRVRVTMIPAPKTKIKNL